MCPGLIEQAFRNLQTVKLPSVNVDSPSSPLIQILFSFLQHYQLSLPPSLEACVPSSQIVMESKYFQRFGVVEVSVHVEVTCSMHVIID